MKLYLFFLLAICFGMTVAASVPSNKVNYESFLGQHDMLWDRVPHRWEISPYTGNGNVGFLFYQAKGEAKNVISIYAGRHDYYDHRLPYEGKDLLWIYRGRLPLGHFNVESKGDIEGVDLSLSLWNAELTGSIKTSSGEYKLRGLSHSELDVIYFETETAGGEEINITWHPDVPFSSVRKTLDAGGGPKAGGSWQLMRDAPYPLPEEPTFTEEDGVAFCYQPLVEDRGETTTGWEILSKNPSTQILLASIHHSFPEHNSLETVKRNLEGAKDLLKEKTFISTHQNWWHQYYPQSFLSINDPEKEAFYWIQMYKLASAMRENGPILDLMGPWYHKTFWPMVWGDLNVQLIYWTHLTSNRMDLGESLVRNIDKYAENLAKNGPEDWIDSANMATLFPQDMDAQIGKKVPDMLAWLLHNYWLHCEYEGNRERMRDGLFPILRKTMNTYLHYFREFPVVDEDGTIHIKNSWSPEYPGGHGKDINFTIGLIRWVAQTLLNINDEFQIQDPLAEKWRYLLDHLVDFQIDETGLRVGVDIPFDKPHRHYSHLLPFYPLNVISPEKESDAKMLKKTLDHWLDVSFFGKNETNAMAVTGYTATGAASMYACLGETEKSYEYLDNVIQHKNVSSTTMYAEGNPVIESPLSYATCVHDMLLQSWGGKIRVFRGTPEKWTDIVFSDLRTQGAFLVSGKKKGGVTEFVSVESLVGSPCFVQMDIPNPTIYVNGKLAEKDRILSHESGMYEIALEKGELAVFTRRSLEETDLKIDPIVMSEEESNLFGYSEKTVRLPGHVYYRDKKN